MRERGQPLRGTHREGLEAMVGRQRAQAGDAVSRFGAEGCGEQICVFALDWAGVIAASQVLIQDPSVEQAAAWSSSVL